MKTTSILCGMVVLSIAAGTGWARETEPVYCFRVFPNERSCLGRLEGANHRSRLVEDATAQSRGRNRIEIAGEAPTPTRDARDPADLDERRVTAIPGLRVGPVSIQGASIGATHGRLPGDLPAAPAGVISVAF